MVIPEFKNRHFALEVPLRYRLALPGEGSNSRHRRGACNRSVRAPGESKQHRN